MTGGEERKPKDVAERLLAIMLSIAASRRGVTKRDLFKTIPEYASVANTKTAQEALEKRFERDIDDLRLLGVNIEVQDDGDNQTSRYVMLNGTFSWPKGFHLSAKQISLLTLAGSVWQQAAYSSSAAQALDRARAFGDLPEDSGLIGWSPRLQTAGEAFYPVSKAIEKHRVIEFNYRKPGSSELTLRRLHPWKLSHVAGQWMVTGFDDNATGEHQIRNFLLKRVVGAVKTTDEAARVATEAELAAATLALDAHTAGQIAELTIRRYSPAYNHFAITDAGDSEWVTHKFSFMDAWLLADELREFDADIKVVGPAQLAQAYREGFERIADDHA
jgi:proteasome accessory factor B